MATVDALRRRVQRLKRADDTLTINVVWPTDTEGIFQDMAGRTVTRAQIDAAGQFIRLTWGDSQLGE